MNNFFSLPCVTYHVSKLANAYVSGLTGQKCLLRFFFEKFLNSKNVESLQSVNIFQHFQNETFRLRFKAMFVGQD